MSKPDIKTVEAEVPPEPEIKVSAADGFPEPTKPDIKTVEAEAPPEPEINTSLRRH